MRNQESLKTFQPRTRAAVVAASFALVAISCGEGATTGAETEAGASSAAQASSKSTPAPVNTRYESVYDLRGQVEASGVECTSWEVQPESINAVEAASCTDSLVLSIHSDASQVRRSIDLKAALLKAIDKTSIDIVGPNWSVHCGELDPCTQLRETVGGELVVSDPD